MQATLIEDIWSLRFEGRNVQRILGGKSLQNGQHTSRYEFCGARTVLHTHAETLVWDTGKLIATLQGLWWVTPNGLYALRVHSGGVVRVWEFDKAQVVREFGEYYMRLNCTDDTYVLLDHHVWNFMDGTFCYELPEDINRAKIQDNYILVHYEYEIKVFDVHTGEPKYTIRAETSIFATTPDLLLTGSSDRRVQLWNIHTGIRIHTWKAEVQYKSGILTDKYVAFVVSHHNVFVYNLLDQTSCTIQGDIIHELYMQDDLLLVRDAQGAHKYKLHSPLLPAFAISLALRCDGDGAYFRLLCERL